jgi:cadmium resistance protein CadD (predicted permease)
MFLSLFLILLVVFSGFALTYLFAEDETFLWRLAAGNIVGSAVFGLVGFVVANFFGLYAPTVFISLAAALLPLILFVRKDIQKRFERDWDRAKGKIQGANYKKGLRFAYYVLFFALFWFFFERAMFETRAGIMTGGSQNFGDLPFHLGAIFGFTEGQNFPPQNPSFAGARFSYPFMADFLTACLVKIGVSVETAIQVQNASWAFSLLVVLERFTFKFTNSKLAGKLAPVLLFFSGGLGFLWFAKDYGQSTQHFLDFIWNIPHDYTIGDGTFRWGNSMTTLFMTQRSLLLGMPLMIIVLQKIRELFTAENQEEKINRDGQDEQDKKTFSIFHFPFSIFLVGLLAGTLPLIHAHSLIVLFIVCTFLFALSPEKWREWIAFGIGTAIIALPELFFAMSGSATKTSEFIDWHFGWDAGKTNIFWFWLKNTGILIPMLIAGIYLVWKQGTKDEEQRTEEKTHHKDEKAGKLKRTKHSLLVPRPLPLLQFYIPFLFCFILSNSMKLAPWEWDNIKVLIYWFVGSIPFVAFALAWIYNKGKVFKFVAAACLLVLIAAGATDVWRVVSRQISYAVFPPDAIKIAEQIKAKTEPNAQFLNAPTFNTAVVLSGRRSMMRYLGHLSSHGIDYTEREIDLQRIYEGNATADIFIRKYGIEYVLISPEERAYTGSNHLPLNEEYFQKYPVVAESGEYRVYKVK